MSHTASEVSVFTPTNELRQVFGEPALVGSEKLEVYDKLFLLIASTIKPTDPIGWLLTKDVTDWAWEMPREQVIKAEIIKYYQKEVVAELIKKLAPPGQLMSTMYRIFQADDDVTLWETDAEARAKIDEALAAKGHSAPSILAQAYIRGATQIDAIDRRIAAYERRRKRSRVLERRRSAKTGAGDHCNHRGRVHRHRRKTLMTSDQQIAANRNNAKRSTGPRSKAGREMSCRNALRHGLAICAGSAPAMHDDIEKLAAVLSHSDGAKGVCENARVAAEAHLDLLPIRSLRACLFERHYFVVCPAPDNLTKLNNELVKLERYERRAFSKRKRGLRALR